MIIAHNITPSYSNQYQFKTINLICNSCNDKALMYIGKLCSMGQFPNSSYKLLEQNHVRSEILGSNGSDYEEYYGM